MCGIAGAWSRAGHSSDAVRLRRGLDAIRHRGPDDIGEFAWNDPSGSARVDLGLTRLAVLDLSAAGHQPMTLGERYTISFNGEITNFVELRDELTALGERFVSGGDTEVLLRAWAHWGLATLDRVEGMFAFAVLDTQQRTLTLARDPFGIKPLFYSHTGERLTFNSEMVGLLASLDTSPKLDWQTAVDYLQWATYDHTERTFVDGVRQLRPGHYLVLDIETGNLAEPECYWKPSVTDSFDGSYADAVDGVRTLFLDSVKHNLRSDVPVGIALSGGVDSSAIVGAARLLEPKLPLHTFSFIAPGFAKSEHEWIEKVVRETGAVSHTVQAAPEDLERDLDDLIRTQGEPFGSTSIFAQYRVFNLARENGVTVTLDGQGGDEVFAGYDGYPANRMHSLIERGHWVSAVRFARAWAEWPDRELIPMLTGAVGHLLPSAMQGRVLKQPLSPLLDRRALREREVRIHYSATSDQPVRGSRLKSHLLTALTRHGLPALLRHGDRNSMRFSVESRVPFLDRRLIEFVFSLPENWLIGMDGTSKFILRDAVRDFVPEEIITRKDKIGFATPQNDWLKRIGALHNDREHPIGFLLRGRSDTLVAGLSEAELRWSPGSHWRLINLKKWLGIYEIDAS